MPGAELDKLFGCKVDSYEYTDKFNIELIGDMAETKVEKSILCENIKEKIEVY